MNIRDQIQVIIDKRKEQLPAIEQKLCTLDKIEGQISGVERMCAEIIKPDGTVIEDGKYAPILQKNPDMAWEVQALDLSAVRAASARAREALEAYRSRCARRTVNISVVGKARIGKSELLKAISGLSSKVIPAFDGPDCTGAPSVIYNKPGSELKAHITFKTQEEMVRVAQVYLDRMIPELRNRPLLRSVTDIRGLNLADVEKKIPPASAESILLPYLAKLVEHYDEWAAYAGGAPLDFFDENEIITFVAQNNGFKVGEPGREEYYKYQVVDSCEITCSFPQSDVGSISLIDTVGLGDHTEGIQESMLQTVKDRSDGVIFMIRPLDGSGGGVPKDIVDIYKSIAKRCVDKNLDAWLSWFINHDVRPGGNTAHCQAALQTIQNSRWSGYGNARIINALDTAAVQNEFLMPLLESITQNLHALDQSYRSDAETALKDLQAAYNTLCGQVQKVLRSDIRSNAKLIPLIQELADQTMKQLRSELFSFLREWRDKRNQPCIVLDQSTRDIFRRMRASSGADIYLPSQQEILSELETGERPSDLYTKYADSIRNRISRDFLYVDFELQNAIQQMKSDLAAVLYEKCGLKKLCAAPDDGQPGCQWFDDFAQSVLGEEYPDLRLAANTISKFEFSVKGFLTYEVRSRLDEMDMIFQNVPPLAMGGDTRRSAISIYTTLHQKLCRIANDLEREISALCIKPNCAMYAEIADFYDRVYYSDGAQKEWRNLLTETASLLWAEQLRQQQTEGILFQEWIDMVEGLQTYNTGTTFRI